MLFARGLFGACERELSLEDLPLGGPVGNAADPLAENGRGRPGDFVPPRLVVVPFWPWHGPSVEKRPVGGGGCSVHPGHR